MNNKLSKNIKSFWSNNKSIFLFLSLMLVFRSAVADWNEVPTGSMKPTIVEGDRIFVNKMAYDLRLPFTHISLLTIADPKPGDIVVFDSEKSGKKLVKRVIGLPGDVVAMQNNVLTINNQPLSYSSVTNTAPMGENEIIKTEKILNIDHKIKLQLRGSRLSNFTAVTVPKDHYLVLGDNRDNSADSRVIGFVPRDEIVGQAKGVVVSLNYDNYYLPRTERFLKTL
jgi:signal peptidase I